MSGLSATSYDGYFKAQNSTHWIKWEQSQQFLEHLCDGTVHFEVPIYLLNVRKKTRNLHKFTRSQEIAMNVDEIIHVDF
jgi:hypothetical protein